VWRLDPGLAQRLHARANAAKWHLSVETFSASLSRSAQQAFAGRDPAAGPLETFFSSLHLEDLALACACAEGAERAWDHFVSDYRPVLYRAADAIDPSGRAREAADSLYGELFGLTVRDGERQSHFRYFHGRSSLSTWLRAVLAQRFVDQLRRDTRLQPIVDDLSSVGHTTAPSSNLASSRYAELLCQLVIAAVAGLPPRDRLRLRCYYSQDLTLAQIGKLLREHEATVSRQLARARRLIRNHAEMQLREGERMGEAEIAECFAAVQADPGTLDVAELLGDEEALATDRKKRPLNRS